MTVTEFSNEMDIIYENINKGGAPGLNEYEKSVILTTAQDKLVEALADRASHLIPESIKTIDIDCASGGGRIAFSNSKMFNLPMPYLKLLSGRIRDENSPNLGHYTVIPITHQEYEALKVKPYSYPPKRVAWLLASSAEFPDKNIEIAFRPEVDTSNMAHLSYRCTYLAQPDPIILEDLSGDGLTIRGKDAVATSKLNAAIHPKIVEYAVQVAEQYYMDKYPQEKQQTKE